MLVVVQDSAEEEGHHSPWELFSPGAEVSTSADEAPCLPAAITEKVAEVVEGLMGLQRFAAYTELPDPAERWVAAGLGRGNLDVTSLLEVHHVDE